MIRFEQLYPEDYSVEALITEAVLPAAWWCSTTTGLEALDQICDERLRTATLGLNELNMPEVQLHRTRD